MSIRGYTVLRATFFAAAIVIALISGIVFWLFGGYSEKAISELLASSIREENVPEKTVKAVEHSMQVFSQMNSVVEILIGALLTTSVFALVICGILASRLARIEQESSTQ